MRDRAADDDGLATSVAPVGMRQTGSGNTPPASVGPAVAVPSGLTRHVAERVSGLALDAIAPADVERARHSTIDWLAAAIAGSATDPARSLRIALERAGQTSGPATVVGTRHRAPARDAALVNGVAAHSLELDDVSVLMGGHPAVSVCSSVLALAEALDATGRDVLPAIVAGYDAACRIAVALGPGHAGAGWHVTGTIGTFAAAAGCSRLLGLTVSEVESALGLAASAAAGLNAGIGTAAKPTHAGRAAGEGLLVALLAAEGAAGPACGIERYGAAAGAAPDVARLDDLGADQGIRATVLKRHACCGLLQPTVTAIVRLRAEHGIDAGDVRSVAIETSDAVLSICSFRDPADDLQAKFSITEAAAVALTSDDTGPTAFSAAVARRPGIAALRGLVSTGRHDARSTSVVVELHSGEILRTSEDPAQPAADGQLGAQLAQLRAKFAAVVAPVIGTARADALLKTTEGLDSASSLRDVLALTRPAP